MGKEQREQSGQALGGKAGPTEMCFTWSLGQRKEMKVLPPLPTSPSQGGRAALVVFTLPCRIPGKCGFLGCTPQDLALCVSDGTWESAFFENILPGLSEPLSEKGWAGQVSVTVLCVSLLT